MTDHGPIDSNVAEAALRGRLLATDGLEGDRIEGERAFMRAAGEPDLRNVDPIVLRETRKGGRYAPVRVRIGDRAGNSVVLDRAGVDRTGLHRMMWLVSCGGCGRTQLRSSGQVNFARRHRHEIMCPECILEAHSGMRMARAAFLLERVREGGPIWTDTEIQWLKDGVQADLEAEFGDVEDMDDIGTMQYAVGYPWSIHDRRTSREAAAEREEERRHNDNRAAGALVAAIASGNVDEIQRADSELRETETEPITPYVSNFMHEAIEEYTSLTRVSRAIKRCVRCRQRFCGSPSEKTCSRECEVVEWRIQRAVRLATKDMEAAKEAAEKSAIEAIAAEKRKQAAQREAVMKVNAARAQKHRQPQHRSVATFRAMMGQLETAIDSVLGDTYFVPCGNCHVHGPFGATPEEAGRKAFDAGFGVRLGSTDVLCAACRRLPPPTSQPKVSDVYNFTIADRFVIASKWQPHLFLQHHRPGERRWGPREAAREFTVQEIDTEISVKAVDDLYFVITGQGGTNG